MTDFIVCDFRRRFASFQRYIWWIWNIKLNFSELRETQQSQIAQRREHRHTIYIKCIYTSNRRVICGVWWLFFFGYVCYFIIILFLCGSWLVYLCLLSFRFGYSLVLVGPRIARLFSKRNFVVKAERVLGASRPCERAQSRILYMFPLRAILPSIWVYAVKFSKRFYNLYT